MAQVPTPISTIAAPSPEPAWQVSNEPGTATPTGVLLPESSDVWNASHTYSLLHFELLDHFREKLIGIVNPISPYFGQMLLYISRDAPRTPYLMDELLALAAAHKSTLPGERRDLYRTESTRLQTRALAGFRQEQAMAVERPLATFTFSAMLGQHVLFDAFSDATDLPAALDKFAQCVRLHHGIRTIAGQHWEKIRETLPSNQLYRATNSIVTTGTECDEICGHLRRSNICKETLETYEATVKILQYMFDTIRSWPDRRIVVAQEWSVRVSWDYILLVQQRRPEAMVILAYYAVLLHYGRDYWAIGDSGKFLIQSISSHLGDYWSDWLRWPNQVVNDT